jgi:hypothetical protein
MAQSTGRKAKRINPVPAVSLFLFKLLNEGLNVGLGLLLGVTPQIAQVSVDGKHWYS